MGLSLIKCSREPEGLSRTNGLTFKPHRVTLSPDSMRWNMLLVPLAANIA
jgi:hypothetical protein